MNILHQYFIEKDCSYATFFFFLIYNAIQYHYEKLIIHRKSLSSQYEENFLKTFVWDYIKLRYIRPTFPELEENTRRQILDCW